MSKPQRDSTSQLVESNRDSDLIGVPVAFKVDSESSANWVIRKIVDSRRYADCVKEWSDRELSRAQREEEFLMRAFGQQLSAWTQKEIAKLRGRRKSIQLPAGAVGFRTHGPKLVVDDAEIVIAWAKRSCPSAVEMVPKLRKTELNDHFAATGEVPDRGAHIEPGGELFYVK